MALLQNDFRVVGQETGHVGIVCAAEKLTTARKSSRMLNIRRGGDDTGCRAAIRQAQAVVMALRRILKGKDKEENCDSLLVPPPLLLVRTVLVLLLSFSSFSFRAFLNCRIDLWRRAF